MMDEIMCQVLYDCSTELGGQTVYPSLRPRGARSGPQLPRGMKPAIQRLVADGLVTAATISRSEWGTGANPQPSTEIEVRLTSKGWDYVLYTSNCRFS